MPIVSEQNRKNAFSHRLKDKREKSCAKRSEMTPDQIRIFGKTFRETSTWIGNLWCAIEEPSLEQAKKIDDALRELVERIEQIRNNKLQNK